MKEIKFYDWNLEKSPMKNWKKIFKDFDLSSLKTNIVKILSSYQSVINIAGSFISLENIMFREELEYLAKKLKLTLLETVLLQLIYESSSACSTGIFKINDDFLFFRTMDWPMEFLKDYTIGLNIIKNKKLIAKIVTWTGYVGVLTVTNLEKNYTIAINYRRTKNINFMTLVQNAFKTINGNWPIGYLVRWIIFNRKKNPIKILKEYPLISPCYITFFANEKSCIITRSAEGVDNLRKTNLMQTNCDWDKKTPNILWSVQRREKMEYLTSLSLTKDDLISNLLSFPIVNEETIYTFIIYQDTINCYV